MSNYADSILEVTGGLNGAELLGFCEEMSAKLVALCPELRVVRGHYLCPLWGPREHWWCVAPDGTIVDPTAEQFPSGGLGRYETWDESREEPTGKCMNCGAYVFGRFGNVCSDDCGTAVAASMGGS